MSRNEILADFYFCDGNYFPDSRLYTTFTSPQNGTLIRTTGKLNQLNFALYPLWARSVPFQNAYSPLRPRLRITVVL